VRAAGFDDDFSTFIDRDNGQYRAVLLLLAISVGRTDVAPEILEDLHNASSGYNFSAWLDDQAILYDEKRIELETARTTGAKRVSGEVADKEDREYQLGELSKVTKKISEDMKTVSKALKELGAAPLDNNLANYIEWAREVGRYSFRWHLKPKE
jgi:hypothetical protein